MTNFLFTDSLLISNSSRVTEIKNGKTKLKYQYWKNKTNQGVLEVWNLTPALDYFSPLYLETRPPTDECFRYEHMKSLSWTPQSSDAKSLNGLESMEDLKSLN